MPAWNRLLITLFVALTLSAAAACDDDLDGPVAVVTLKIKGMTCAACTAGIAMALERVHGVKKASVSYKKTEARIEYVTTAVKTKALIAAIERLGYQASQ